MAGERRVVCGTVNVVVDVTTVVVAVDVGVEVGDVWPIFCVRYHASDEQSCE